MSFAHLPKRDVSPLGASRFEKPMHTSVSPQTNTCTAATPPSSHSLLFSKYHRPRPADSLFSHDTMDTSPTSFSSDERLKSSGKESSIESPVCTVSPEEWFARFHTASDFDGTESDECPDRATLAAVQEIPLYDAEGNERTFGSIYDPTSATHQRQLVIFVRHFYCGACQAYLKALTESISMRDYFSIPTPTSIIIIGCGQPDLIPHYKTFTGCPFPMFADPSRQLFKKLGMVLSLKTGKETPEYMKDISKAQWLAGQVKTIKDSLKDPEGIRKRDIVRGGNPLQIGGEFLFDDGEVIWCHRMQHYRDHTEMGALRKILELDE
ncbi:hypothetical protein PRZ48_008730 [Zasmidium cellare]|uniref:Thioredoxin-like protein AAED1 n=1 Tax=Zasmidium cellare TaxID=395010 RepID=A0ABR0EH31_ZASCE|nr:hypothetical protein PRZ48_008730 [Zasmidium cellare]